MPDERYCGHCGKHVTCKTTERAIPGTVRTMTELACPECGRVLASIYDREFAIQPTRRH